MPNEDPAGDEQSEAATPKQNQSTRLVELALEVYLLGVTPEGKTFAFVRGVPHIGLPLKGSKLGLRQNLARRYYLAFKSAASASALNDAMSVLDGMATEAHPVPMNVRVAGDATAVYVDLGGESNRVIMIAKGEWSIVKTAPHVFSRSELTAAMVDPVRKGTFVAAIAKLWGHLNVAEPDRPVLLAAMVDALIQPGTPKPVVGYLAEHGTAKSTTMKRVVDLIDSSSVPLRSAPRDLPQWLVAAAGSWVVALDNLSGLPQWLSDAICRASTGEGSVKRALYSDDALAVSQFRRLVMLSSIDLGGLQGDFTDRLVGIELRRISDERRHTEAELQVAWDRDVGEIFGGLLELAAKVHAMLPGLETTSLPRMADFARVLICVDAIMQTEGMKRFDERRQHLMADSATSNTFIANMIERRYENHHIEGDTAATILKYLPPEDDKRPPPDWPKKSRDVTSLLSKHAPALRSMGWEISNDNAENKSNALKWFITPPPKDGSGWTS